MRIGKVIGKVTLNRAHPSFTGATLKLTVPQSLANITGESLDEADTIVVYDQLGAGMGSYIGISDGAEASQPFRPEMKPIDAYNSAILDEITLF